VIRKYQIPKSNSQTIKNKNQVPNTKQRRNWNTKTGRKQAVLGNEF
jgi:hypothetical protein